MHLTEIQLRQLADDQLSMEGRKAALRHLLTKCRPCLELARKVLFPEMESEPDYSGVLRRLDLSLVLAQNDVEVERGVARALQATSSACRSLRPESARSTMGSGS